MLRNFLPHAINKRLFGDRKKFGNKFCETDKDWELWLKFYEEFYLFLQKTGSGSMINNWGYKVLKKLDLTQKNILEIGPGNLPHLSFWNGVPRKYIVVDADQNFLEIAEDKLQSLGIDVESHLVKRTEFAEISDESLDIILTFYSLEHIYDLQGLLEFFMLKLKQDGILVGAIPNEGGFAWGAGRFLTTRRFVHKNSKINYDKIICWEHVNFCDQILKKIDQAGFNFIEKDGYPFSKFLPLDLNLISTFICKKATR